MMVKSNLIFIVMLAVSVLAQQMAPSFNELDKNIPDFENLIPKQFAEWEALETNHLQANLYVDNEGQANTNIDSPYDYVLTRTYVNKSSGSQIMLAIAYGRYQRQEVKIHRPELCYPAQGYKVKSINAFDLDLSPNIKSNISANKLFTSSQNGFIEAVTYWIRIGDIYSQSPVTTRLYILREGIKGNVPDGVLMRVSERLIHNRAELDIDSSWALQQQFIQNLLDNSSEEVKAVLLSKN